PMPLPGPASATHLATAAADVLGRGQLAHADRAARVQLLGRVADLGAHPVLESVGEPGRGVDVDGGCVDSGDEGVGGKTIFGDDCLRVAGPVRVDVLDRVLDR